MPTRRTCPMCNERLVEQSETGEQRWFCSECIARERNAITDPPYTSVVRRWTGPIDAESLDDMLDSIDVALWIMTADQLQQVAMFIRCLTTEAPTDLPSTRAVRLRD